MFTCVGKSKPRVPSKRKRNDDEEDEEQTPKKKSSTRGRKKKQTTQVYLKPSKEQIQLFKDSRKKMPRRKDKDKETKEETAQRKAVEALESARSASFEIDPMLLVPPPKIIASRILYQDHVLRLARRFRIMGAHFPRKTMYAAVPYVSLPKYLYFGTLFVCVFFFVYRRLVVF